jgi:hypothetical protein
MRCERTVLMPRREFEHNVTRFVKKTRSLGG